MFFFNNCVGRDYVSIYVDVECVISQIGTSYYWASRQNVLLVRIDSGAFTTFVAPNGAGYIGVVKPEMKPAAALMSPTEERFDYVEHLHGESCS